MGDNYTSLVCHGPQQQCGHGSFVCMPRDEVQPPDVDLPPRIVCEVRQCLRQRIREARLAHESIEHPWATTGQRSDSASIEDLKVRWGTLRGSVEPCGATTCETEPDDHHGIAFPSTALDACASSKVDDCDASLPAQHIL